MKTRSRVACLALCFAPAAPGPSAAQTPAAAPEPAAATIDLGQGWLFHRGDLAPAFRFRPVRQLDTPTTRPWRSVDLPHDWSVESPFDSTLASSTGYLPGGVGWYQRSFEWAPREHERVSVHFEAVSSNSTAWLNGRLLGERPNGYIGFEYDLTPHLVEGTNVLTVRVDRSRYADSRWYPGAGIYGGVALLVRDPLHIPTWGVFVTTPEIGPSGGTVNVRTAVRNAGSTARPAEVRYRVVGPLGQEVGGSEATTRVAAGDSVELSVDIPVGDPRLWSPETPHLYGLVVELRSDGRVLDRRRVAFGIRSFRFDADEGFFLNGVNTLIKGVCLHHDAGVFGAAVPRRVWERRLALLKEAGTNAIRISHNPAPPHLLSLADSMGFLVMAEAFDEWRHPKNKWVNGWNVGVPALDGYAESFDEWGRRDLQDMILRDRNHPSIILWSIGNEIDYPNDPYSHPVLDDAPEAWVRYVPERPHADELGEVARQLVAWVREVDTTRPVTAALASTLMSNRTGYPQALDVVGYNYQESRYAEDRAAFPDRVILGSENARASYDAWRAVLDNPYVAGQFIWTGIDYLGEAGAWPSRSNTSGFLDLAGFRKARFYIQKAFWDDEPFLQVATTAGRNPANASLHWEYAAGDSVSVYGFTNLDFEADHVEAFVNGRSAGRQTRADFVNGFPQWRVAFERGTVRVEAARGGEVVARSELTTPGPAARLRASADTERVPGSRPALVHVAVEIEDQDGILAANARHVIAYDVQGPARVVGVESGDPTSHEVYRSGSRSRAAFNGRLMIYLETTGEAGTVSLRVTGEGLVGDETRIEVR